MEESEEESEGDSGEEDEDEEEEEEEKESVVEDDNKKVSLTVYFGERKSICGDHAHIARDDNRSS